jgi:hypothetical protein
MVQERWSATMGGSQPTKARSRDNNGVRSLALAFSMPLSVSRAEPTATLQGPEWPILRRTCAGEAPPPAIGPLLCCATPGARAHGWSHAVKPMRRRRSGEGGTEEAKHVANYRPTVFSVSCQSWCETVAQSPLGNRRRNKKRTARFSVGLRVRVRGACTGVYDVYAPPAVREASKQARSGSARPPPPSAPSLDPAPPLYLYNTTAHFTHSISISKLLVQ